MSYFIHAETNGFLTDFLAAGPYWVGLYTTIPDRNGASGVEVTASPYARMPITFNAPANSVVSNTASITFPTPVATGGYGEIVSMGLFDALSGGTVRAILEPPSGSFTMPVGYDRAFAAGYITLEFRE